MARSLAASPARTNRLFLVLALLLSMLSAVFVYMALNRDTGGDVAVPGETRTVVVAKVPIGARETITADMLDRKQVPISAVVTGAVENLEEAVGKVTLYPIAVNQQLSSSVIANAGSAGTIDSLSFTIPPGKRAMSIAVDQVVSAGGLILPGDFVDIIGVFSVEIPGKEATDSFFSRVVLENVQVLAVDQRLVKVAPVTQGEDGLPIVPQGEENAKATTMTLLVDPREAEWLFLADVNGKLRAIVRSYGDDAVVNPEPVTKPELVPPSVIAAYEAMTGQP